MQTIIIGDGLTKEFLSAEAPFSSSRQSVGRAEIDRLLGRGKEYGNGPLGAFLRAAAEGRGQKAEVRLIVLRADGPVPEVLEPILSTATIIPTANDVIPWRELGSAITGETDDPALRFILVGCHTERRILTLASYLRSVLGYTEVAVSPHLVGSATQEAHFAALRHHFPIIGVKVILDLAEVADYAGLEVPGLETLRSRPPELGPQEIRDALDGPQRRILELLCLNWTRAELRPLAGGFSGSLLLLASGWKGQQQKQLSEVYRDAWLGRFTYLLVWSLDRLTREGVSATLEVIEQIGRYGVTVTSLQESWTEVDGPLRELLLSIVAWVARMESDRRSERTKAGLNRAVAEGKTLGRPKGSTDKKKRRRSGYFARYADNGTK